LDPSKSNFVWWQFVLQDLTLGFGVGIAAGFAAGYVRPHEKSLYALGLAFATYALAHALGGNGLIAVFVCSITLGIRRPDIGAAFETEAHDISEIVKLGVFVVFGSLLTLGALLNY